MRIPCKVNTQDGHVIGFVGRETLPTMAVVVMTNGSIEVCELKNIKVTGEDEQITELRMISNELQYLRTLR